MTQKQANDVKHLASPCYKAIKAIAGERKCAECKGKGFHWAMTVGEKERKKDSCVYCNGTGKVGWKWEPEVGEWCITPGNDIRLVDNDLMTSEVWRYWKKHNEWPIPILHWETIEEILEGVGYDLHIKDFWEDIERTEKFYTCYISKGYKNKMLNVLVGGEYEECEEPKSRQEAVMLAVIELGKEIK